MFYLKKLVQVIFYCICSLYLIGVYGIILITLITTLVGFAIAIGPYLLQIPDQKILDVMHIIIESVFAWPGIGRLGYDAVLRRDYPTIMALTMLTATFVMWVNVLVDSAYSLVDPRIRY